MKGKTKSISHEGNLPRINEYGEVLPIKRQFQKDGPYLYGHIHLEDAPFRMMEPPCEGMTCSVPDCDQSASPDSGDTHLCDIHWYSLPEHIRIIVEQPDYGCKAALHWDSVKEAIRRAGEDC